MLSKTKLRKLRRSAERQDINHQNQYFCYLRNLSPEQFKKEVTRSLQSLRSRDSANVNSILTYLELIKNKEGMNSKAISTVVKDLLSGISF